MNRAEQNVARSAGDVPASALRPDLLGGVAVVKKFRPSNRPVKAVQR